MRWQAAATGQAMGRADLLELRAAMTPAAQLLNYLKIELDRAPIAADAGVETVVDLISGAPPDGKKALLAAIGRAMMKAEVERQGKRK